MAWGACHDVSKCDCWIPQMREDGAEYSPALKVSRMRFFYFYFFYMVSHEHFLVCSEEK